VSRKPSALAPGANYVRHESMVFENCSFSFVCTVYPARLMRLMKTYIEQVRGLSPHSQLKVPLTSKQMSDLGVQEIYVIIKSTFS
jgi:hypothetical protein